MSMRVARSRRERCPEEWRESAGEEAAEHPRRAGRRDEEARQEAQRDDDE